MTQKTISQESAATRLLTGALVEIQDPVAGSRNVSVDTLLKGPTFDSPTQFLGATAANTMEVEANSLAARLTLRPDDINNPLPGWKIGRHAYSGANFGYGTNGASSGITNGIFFEFAWVNVAGIAIIKKVFFSFLVGASTNTASGTANVSMFRTYGLGSMFDASNVQMPGAQTGLSVGGRSPQSGASGLWGNQSPPLARVNAGVTKTSRGGANAEQAWQDAQPIGCIDAGFRSGAGRTIFQNVTVFDYQVAGQPLILVPGTGFELQFSIPTSSAGSSTTFMEFGSVHWDEWTLSNPGAAL